MTSLAARKSKQEWNQHESKIRELYYDRHESLSNVKKIMEIEHNFSASRAQYENYIKSLGQPKNLKKEQWKAVLLKVEELRKKKLGVRVKLSGEVLGEERLQRSRRHALHGQAASMRKPEDNTVPLPDCLVIETQNHDGEWSAYEGEAVVDQANPSASIHNLTHEESANAFKTVEPKYYSAQQSGVELAALETVQLRRMHSPRLLESSFRAREPCNSHRVQQLTSSHMTGYERFDFADLDIRDDELYYSYDGNSQEFRDHIHDLFLQTPFIDPFQNRPWHSVLNQYQLERNPPAQSLLRWPANQSHHNALPERGTYLELAHVSQLDPTSLAQLLFQDDPIHPTPAIRDMMVNLHSLLPSDFQYNVFGGTDNAIVKDTIFDSPLHLAILHSISNDFAGLRDISREDVFKVLKSQENFRSKIKEWIQTNSGQRAKCFTDNLFRAAVEASDEELVDSILSSTKSTIYAIDSNVIVCRLEGDPRKYTPIELAARRGSTGIVKLLIDAKADVNKTYAKGESWLRGALEFAIKRRNNFGELQIDINIVRMILEGGGEVRKSDLDAALMMGSDNLVSELIPRIPSANHEVYFPCIRRAATYQRSTDMGTHFIQYLLEMCKSEGCMRCPTAYQKEMTEALHSAVRRGNVILTNLILRWCPELDTEGCLSAAVRSSKHDLIDRFLTQTSLGDMPTYFGDRSETEYTHLDHPGSTPLAEAIRSGDKDLVREFLNRGALTYLHKSGHFVAAVFASAEVGNLQLLQRFIQCVPKSDRPNLSQALAIAIIRDQSNAASLLLHNGVEDDRDCTALCEALGKQNVELVDEILKNASRRIVEGRILSVLEIAAMRIDKISVIEDLIGCGARTYGFRKYSPVAIAVKARNIDLVNLLLDAGCSPNQATKRHSASPLTVAVQFGEDVEITNLLISRGAEPADKDAFLAAKKNVKTFDTLLRCFCDRYPRGKQGFGCDLLIEAVKSNDITVLRKMLAAKFDIDALCIFEDPSLNALGHAIKCGKKEESTVPIIQELLKHYDPNCIVLRPKSFDRYWHLTESCRDGYKTALLLAVETRSKRIVEFLLENGADVGLPAQRQIKRTPLQRACEIGSFLIVKILIAHGASVNEAPSRYHGGTALQLAARSGCVKIARLLLDCGADIHAAPSTFGGRIPLEAAAENGCLDMITVIWEAALKAGAGFTFQQISKAKELALGNGHRGCAERLETLELDYGLVSPWHMDDTFGLFSEGMSPEISNFL